MALTHTHIQSMTSKRSDSEREKENGSRNNLKEETRFKF